jgi:hypothetical protein
VDDVVRAPREVLLSVLGTDDVVGWSDELIERTGALAVPLGTEETHLGHGWTVP